MSLHTPILVGVGQITDRIDAPVYAALSPQRLAAKAVTRALEDAGIGDRRERVDRLACVRTVADSIDVATSEAAYPFGGPNNFPRSVAHHAGIDPDYAIYSIACGDEPQVLVNELCAAIASGETRLAVVCGAEAAGTVRHTLRRGEQANWREGIAGQVEDRGQGTDDLLHEQMPAHGMPLPLTVYPLFEHARRHRLGMTIEAYNAAMATLLARFNDVAQHNPYATHPEPLSASDIGGRDSGNRIVSYPYTKAMVARDAVNQGAAVVLTSSATARELGIPEDRWVYLHGHAATVEMPVHTRPDLSQSPAMVAAYQYALSRAGRASADIHYFDLYSCFPIAVFIAMEALGLRVDDPRQLTVTGGLPYFGGPGNNYSMHALASMVDKLRCDAGAFGLVGTNGGYLSRHAVGIYSTTPTMGPPAFDSKTIQDTLNRAPQRDFDPAPQGVGHIESFMVKPTREGFEAGIIGTIAETGKRFIARSIDSESIEQAMVERCPIQSKVTVSVEAMGINTFRFTER